MGFLQWTRPFPPSFDNIICHVLDDGADLAWDLQADGKLATGGTSYQLNPKAKAASVRFSLLMRSFIERISDPLRQVAASEIDDPTDRLVPQLFPVKMFGCEDRPPYQLPHQDNHAFRPNVRICPRYTFVYYAKVDNCHGGDLLLFDPIGNLLERFTPSTGVLICMPGTQWHAVERLTKGERLSLVLNLYDPSHEVPVERVWPGGDKPY